MKIHRNKMILIVFALQLLMLLAVIAMVCAVSGRGRTVTLEMAGYDPYDTLRGRYLRLSSPDSRVTLEPGSIERYENRRQSTIPVYVVLDTDPDSGISGFSYASLDCPDSNTPYIRCSSQYLRIYEDGAQISIQPRIEQYYLNERHADALEQSITRDSNILLRLKIWRGMYVVDGLTVDGQAY